MSLGVQAGVNAINNASSTNRSGSGSAIQIDHKERRTSCKRGMVNVRALADLEQIFNSEHLRNASVTRSASGHFTFSQNIPEGIRQRIINIIVNS